MKKKLLFAAASIVSIVILGMYLSTPANTKTKSAKGKVDIREDPSSDIPPISVDLSEWESADEALDETMYALTITDSENVLSTIGFLPTKAHFTKCQAIYEFLKGKGYDETSVTVLPESCRKEGSNSIFTVSLEHYADVCLIATYYGISGDWQFELAAQ